MPTTLADIARELGISKMTVSRAINNHPEINTETRERVLTVARRMNYRPNQHARALATNRSYLLGLIVPDLMHSYYAELLRSIESVARPAGFQILVCNTEEDATREIDEVEVLLHRTDGLIIASALPPTEVKQYGKMIKEGAKIVLVDRELRNLRCPAVTTDNVQVGKLATTHLINLGHHRIGHLLGNETVVGLERYEGYKQALAEHKLPFEGLLVRKCGFLEEDGFNAMHSWIAEGDFPRAIFAANDPAAIGAMRAIEEAGLSAGKDVALIGAGNIHHGDLLRVPLSTISWSRAEMGQTAVTVLIKLIEENGHLGKGSQRIVIEPKLVVRQSCGAVS